MRARGAFNLRKGWKYFEKALEYVGIHFCSNIIHFLEQNKDSNIDNVLLANLKFGAGMFFFVISLIPSGLAQVSTPSSCFYI